MTMGKVLGIVIGVVLVVLGAWGIVTWWSLFVRALMAAVPALMIVVGVVLVVFFISEIRSSIREKAEMEGTKKSASGEEEATPKTGSEKAQ
jgi:predicted RND superfamily exporter protein